MIHSCPRMSKKEISERMTLLGCETLRKVIVNGLDIDQATKFLQFQYGVWAGKFSDEQKQRWLQSRGIKYVDYVDPIQARQEHHVTTRRDVE